MKMKLSDAANLAEVVAAIAVVISLIYVGIQVNDSTRAVRAAAANDANVAMQNWYIAVGSSLQTSEIMISGMGGTADFTTAEEYQFLMMMHGIFLGIQNSYLLVEEGTLDPRVSETIAAAILGVKDLPGFKEYWRQRKNLLYPGFVDYIEKLISDPFTPPVDLYREIQNERSSEG